MIPSTWIRKFASVSGTSDERAGKAYTVGYYAPASTTLATVEEAVPLKTRYPSESESDIFASRLLRARIDSDMPTGQALATFFYEPPTVEEILIEHTDYVLVEARSTPSTYWPIMDMDKKWINYQKREDGVSVKWERIDGSGLRYKRTMQFRTRFASPYGIGGALLAYQNTVNGAIYSQYWNCPAGTLRFAAWTKNRAPTTKQLWVYDCLIDYDPIPWNEHTVVQKYEYRAYQIEIRKEDGTSFSPKKYGPPVGDWFPTGDPYDAKMCKAMQWPILLRGKYDW